MTDSDNLWTLVLAAGDGRRLQALTTTRTGLAIPKQFCSLEHGPSLLRQAIARAAAVAAPRHSCAVVAAHHRLWWTRQLADLEPANLIVQPRNRGTAIGILLPLVRLLKRDPQARLIILPSDHHVTDEARLAHALRYAAAPPAADRAQILLLGLQPTSADTQLGYIVPRRIAGGTHQAVERFVEKPDSFLAQRLLAQGALWNTFIIAADAQALLQLFERRRPNIVAAMRESVGGGRNETEAAQALASLYESLPEMDFSRSILQGQEQYLRALPVPDCGWSDLGTPERVAAALAALPPRHGLAPEAFDRQLLLSLADQTRAACRATVAAAAGR